MKEFLLPDLGEGLADAEIREWHVNEGDEVNIDDVLVTVETAKAVVEIPSPFKGKIHKLNGASGDIIKTGAALVVYDDGDDSPAKPATSGDAGTVVGNIEAGERVIQESATGVSAADAAKVTRNQGIRATPAVRALARKLNVDLSQIQPSGPGGLITSDDVRILADLNQKPVTGKPLRGVRRGMAINMHRINQEVAQVSVFETADIHNWFGKEKTTIRLIRAIVQAVKAEPSMNAHFDFDLMTMDVREDINIGLAVDTKKGLYAPVLFDVEKRSDEDILKGIELLKADALKEHFKPEQLKDSTILLSNYGTIAGRYATPLVVPPSVAIVGAGKVRDEIRPIDGEIAIRKVLPISISFDHRALTGGDGSRFLAAFIKALEEG